MERSKPKSLPSIEITPAMVIRFARSRKLKVTREEAAEWLKRNRREIERRLAANMDEVLEEVFQDVTLWQWPERAFDAMHHKVDDAIQSAIQQHEESHGVECVAQSWKEEDMHRIVRSFMRHKGPKPKTDSLIVDVAFTPKDADPTADYPEVAFAFDLSYQDGVVTAKLVRRIR